PERHVVRGVARDLGAPWAAAGESLPDAGADLRNALVGDAGAMPGHVSHWNSFVATRGAAYPRGARAAGRWPFRGRGAGYRAPRVRGVGSPTPGPAAAQGY